MRRRITALALLLALAAVALSLGARGTATAAQHSDRITLDEFKALVADGRKPIVVLDVRGEIESKIAGAKHIPLDQLEARMKELPRDREIVTYCA